MSIRARFAPAPSGYMHVGNARTALFNWLFARGSGGTLILRIDDTDLSRTSEEAVAAIVETLGWLGIDWDEGYGSGGDFGPYRQSERFDLYRDAVESLLAQRLAYRCWCTRQELDERRKAAQAAGRPQGYDGRCRELDDQARSAREGAGDESVVRFAIPAAGEVPVEDLIRGEVVFETSTLEDFVILRADGTPTFTLAGAYDDFAMEITHVIRGEDLLPVTPRQVLLTRALGGSPPVYAHLPLIVGADRAPLSKRHGHVSVEWYREAGFVPEALANYLALLGWGPEDGEEIVGPDRLEAEFSLERVSKTPAAFDLAKLDWMNNHYLQKLPAATVLERGLEFLTAEDLVSDPPSEAELAILEAAIPLVQVRMDRLAELAKMVGFLLRTPEIVSEDWDAVMSPDWAQPLLAEMVSALEALGAWEASGIEEALRAAATARGVKPRLAFGPIRVAVSGVRVGPPLFESLEILGAETALGRASRALALLEAHGATLPKGRWPLSPTSDVGNGG